MQSQLEQGDEDSMMLKRLEEAGGKVDTLTEEAKYQSKLKCDLERKWKMTVAPKKNTERELKLLEIKEKDAKDSLVKATKLLQKKRDEIIKAKEGEGESKAAKLTKQLRDAENKLNILNEKKKTLKEQVEQASERYEEIEPDIKQAKEKCEKAQNKLRVLEARLKDLRTSSSNALSLFGRRCCEVKRLVRIPSGVIPSRKK